MSSYCLDIPEILLLICARLGDASLASFAQTNHRICAVALDVLWRKQTSLVPLLQTLPQHGTDLNGAIVLEEYITPVAWEVTQMYARRVKHLSLDGGGFATNFGTVDADIPRQAMEAYALRLGRAPIFPNLRTLDFGFGHSADYDFLHCFITPTLRNLELRYRSGFAMSPRAMHILPAISASCPQLSYLRIHDEDYEFDPNEDEHLGGFLPLADMITGWTELTTVSINEAHPDTIRHFGRCPKLRELTLAAEIDLEWPPADAPAFEHGLSELNISVSKSSFVAAIVASMSNAPMAVECVDVYCWEDNTLCKERNLATFAKALDPAVLHRMVYDHKSYEHDAARPLSVPILAQYKRFSRMVRFEMNLQGASTFDDDALASMLAAWPRLKRLNFGGMYGRYPTPRPALTLSALPPLSQFCPAFKRLTCWLDATDVPLIPERTTTSDADSRLSPPPVALHFDEMAPITEDVDAAARYILTVFRGRRVTLPGRMSWIWDPDNENPMKWKQLQALMKAYNERSVEGDMGN